MSEVYEKISIAIRWFPCGPGRRQKLVCRTRIGKPLPQVPKCASPNLMTYLICAYEVRNTPRKFGSVLQIHGQFLMSSCKYSVALDAAGKIDRETRRDRKAVAPG